MNILTEQDEFRKELITLANPGRLQGGSYYSRILYDNKPFYIQTCKCDTKQGIITTGKKVYCDLKFNIDGQQSFLDIVENIEERIKELLVEKSDLWFSDSLDMDDIEYFFNSSLRSYKSIYQLMRTYINSKNDSLRIYDENKTLQKKEDVANNVVCILSLKGIKFTNQSVHVDIELKQVMILDSYEETNTFDECMIRTKPVSDVISNHVTNESASTIVDESENHEQDEPILVEKREDESESQVISDNTLDNNTESNTEEGETEVLVNTADETLDETENIQLVETETIAREIDELQEVNNTSVESSNDASSLENTEQSIQEVSNDTSQDLDISSNLHNNDNVKENTYDLEEIQLDVNDEEPIQLKKPNEVYYEIYRVARNKARQAKQAAILAYLEAKNIKQTYMLDSDSDDESEYSLDELEHLSE